jgi:hypothetical protein
MKLKGILDFSLGNFLCLRGFAPLGVLQAISKADESYQRTPKDPRIKEISDYLKSGEFLFFPEVILCATLHDGESETPEVNQLWEAIKQGRSKRMMRFVNGIRLSSVVSRSRKVEDIRAVQFYQTATLQFPDKKEGIFSRIDGNHRLSATTDVSVREYITPFCIILCRNATEFRQFSRALFHNINYRQVPLAKEHNLRLILDDSDLFPDDQLKTLPSFGWHYYLARKLRESFDSALLPNLKAMIDAEPYSFLVDNLGFLLDKAVLGPNEKAIPRFKKAISEVNALFNDTSALKGTTNRGLLGSLAYYQLGSPAIVPSFVQWIVDNNIYRIADSSSPDLINIFDNVIMSRRRTIFVSMPFGKAKPDDHYAVIERVADEISEANTLSPPLKVQRVDWFINGTSYIIQDKIIKMISDCGLLIGNLTHCNPNVYHEIGFLMGKAKAEGQDVANILLVLDESVDKDDQFVAFNLRGYAQLRFTQLEKEFAPKLRKYLTRFFDLKG